MTADRWGYFDINGSKIRSGKELVEWLEFLISCGMKSAGISWFGLEGGHDSFVNRDGYYSYLRETALCLRKRGIPVKSKIFLTPRNVATADFLLDEVVGISNSVQFGMVEYTGNAKSNSSLFLTQKMIGSLSRCVRPYLGPSFAEVFRSERNWIHMVKRKAHPSFTHVDYIVYVDLNNCSKLEKMTPESVVSSLDDLDHRIRDSYENEASLADAYGDPEGECVMEWRDLMRKWLGLHYEASGFCADDLFSLTSNSVEWKVDDVLYTNNVRLT